MDSIFNAQPPKRKKGLGFQRRHAEDKLTLKQKKELKKQKKIERMSHLQPLKVRKDSSKKANGRAGMTGSDFMKQSVASFEADPADTLPASQPGKKRKAAPSQTPTTTPTTSTPSNSSQSGQSKSSTKKKQKNVPAQGPLTTTPSAPTPSVPSRGNNESGQSKSSKKKRKKKNNASSTANATNEDDDDSSKDENNATVALTKAPGRKKKASQTLAKVEGNPYLEVYRSAMASMPPDMDQLLKVGLSDERRAHLFSFLDLDYAEKYAWAIPDERALRIVANFGPVVEIGCGRGYWGALLRARGVDWTGYDLHALDDNTGNPAWTEIHKGGPNDIRKHPRSTLMLSYPDDFEDSEQSLAAQCLRNFKGSTIILIGEHFGFTLQDNPWGRSAEALFQQDLAAGFHMLLRVPLPSWPTSWDALSVWKRTTECVVDDVHFRDIPVEERAEVCVACPAMAHLLA